MPREMYVDEMRLTGTFLTAMCTEDIASDRSKLARFELMLALMTEATAIETREGCVTAELTPKYARKFREQSLTLEDLNAMLREVAEHTPIICSSRMLAMGVEIGFIHRLGCVPLELETLLNEWGALEVVISRQPAYGGCVLELYTPDHFGRPWTDVSKELEQIVNFAL